MFVHRATFAELIVTYAAGRLWPGPRVERAGIVTAYAYAFIYPLAGNDSATLLVAVALVGLCGWRVLAGRGPQRRARVAALAGAVAVALVPAGLGLAAAVTGDASLIACDLVLVLTAAGFAANLR